MSDNNRQSFSLENATPTASYIATDSDTWASVAQHYGVSEDELRWFNQRLSMAYQGEYLAEGEELTIYNLPPSVTVERSLLPISEYFTVETTEVATQQPVISLQLPTESIPTSDTSLPPSKAKVTVRVERKSSRPLPTMPSLWAMNDKEDALMYFWISSGRDPKDYTSQAVQQLLVNELYTDAQNISYYPENKPSLLEAVPLELRQLFLNMNPEFNEFSPTNPIRQDAFNEQMLEMDIGEFAKLFLAAQDYMGEEPENRTSEEQSAYDLSQALVYLDALEKGEELPFQPVFDPNQITKDAMYINTGYQLYYYGEGPESDSTQAQVNEELLKYTAQVLLDTSLYADGEQPTEEALIEMFKASLPENFTSQDVALFTNTMMNDILEKQYAGELDYEGQLPGQIGLYSLEELSGIYLSALRVDEIRVELQTWDYEGQIAKLAELEKSLNTRIPEEVLGVSTVGVKGAIVSYISQYRDSLDQHNAELEVWREKMPFIEKYYSQRRSDKEAISDNLGSMVDVMALVGAMAFEPIDWMYSLATSVKTGNPIPFLISLIPLIPGAITKIVSKADELMDIAQGTWRAAGELTDEMIAAGKMMTGGTWGQLGYELTSDGRYILPGLEAADDLSSPALAITKFGDQMGNNGINDFANWLSKQPFDLKDEEVRGALAMYETLRQGGFTDDEIKLTMEGIVGWVQGTTDIDYLELIQAYQYPQAKYIENFGAVPEEMTIEQMRQALINEGIFGSGADYNKIIEVESLLNRALPIMDTTPEIWRGMNMPVELTSNSTPQDVLAALWGTVKGFDDETLEYAMPVTSSFSIDQVVAPEFADTNGVVLKISNNSRGGDLFFTSAEAETLVPSGNYRITSVTHTEALDFGGSMIEFWLIEMEEING